MKPDVDQPQVVGQPTRLLCEYTVDPLGVEAAQPRLSWVAQHAERGRVQSAYQILVASSRAALSSAAADLWDSGQVQSDQSVNVEYRGRALASRLTCCWQVRWWDDRGRVSPFSDVATFEMGLLAADDWQAEWIGGGGLLRREFAIDRPPARARAYVCGLGWYELRINGAKVGDHQLDPGQTDYDRSALYATYDVTQALAAGNNAVGVMLGNGRYAQDWGLTAFPELSHRLKAYDNAVPKLILQLELEFQDGTARTARTVVSDGSWKVAAGPIVANDIYNGETYDARREHPGWDRPDYDDSTWQAADLVEAPRGRLVSQTGLPPIKSIATIPPAAITNPQPGSFVWDFGQNFTGWVRLTVSGPRGTAVELRHAEVLDPDGTLNLLPNGRAEATDTYILKGAGVEVYEPRFTYHGFRYVEVTGYPGTPDLATLLGVVVHSAVERVGGFSCSNPLINRIHHCVVWSQLGNLMSVPTDCPQRAERLGWMGDAQVTVEEAIYNFDMAGFHTKWLRDMREAQRADGSLPDVVPAYWLLYPADPPWGTACVVICWYLYLFYADQRVLAENYAMLKAWVEFLGTKAEGNLVTYSRISDWCPPGRTYATEIPGELVSAWCYYHDVLMLARIARILGESADAEEYATRSQAVAEAFNRRFLKEEDYYGPADEVVDALLRMEVYAERDTKTWRKRYLSSQTADALPLYLEMVPEERRDAVVANLVENVEVTHDGHVSTGIIGTRYLLDTLTKHGRADLAYRLATQTTYPSWGYMIREGATTVWERWEYLAGKGMNSHNHVMFGSVDGWFYRVLAGINQEPAGPGFKRITIKPYVLGDLSHAGASVNTIRGAVAARWQRTERGLSLEVTLPVNSAGEVHVPVLGLSNPVVREGGEVVYRDGALAGGAAGITAARRSGEYVSFAVGSGTYSFTLGDSG